MCRLEKHIIDNKLIIFDVGHNASGIVINQIITIRKDHSGQLRMNIRAEK